jgi:hypothetical protein
MALGGRDPLPLALDDWDYMTTLELSAAVTVSTNRILETCQLGPATSMWLVVSARSDHTRVEDRVALIDVPAGATAEIPVQLKLPGAHLGRRLTLRTDLVINQPEPLGRLAPTRPGSILWTQSHDCDLQGTGSQFPTSCADFRTRIRGHEAGWELTVDLSEPDARFDASVRLTLNTSSPLVAKMLQDVDSEPDKHMRRILHWDITRQLVLAALRCEEALTAAVDPQSTSVAGVLRNILDRVWPGTDPSQIVDWFNHDPNSIEITIQDHCRPFS